MMWSKSVGKHTYPGYEGLALAVLYQAVDDMIHDVRYVQSHEEPMKPKRPENLKQLPEDRRKAFYEKMRKYYKYHRCVDEYTECANYIKHDPYGFTSVNPDVIIKEAMRKAFPTNRLLRQKWTEILTGKDE